MPPATSTLSLSRRVLQILIALNWAFGAGILALLIASLLAPDFVGLALGVGTDPRTMLGARLVMLLGVASTPAVNIVLSRLLAIVETVREGDPFVIANASRLNVIAWAVVALEVARVLVATVSYSLLATSGRIHLDVNISVTPWLAVLLLFVLARVFEQGARMRDELEATI